VHTTDLLRERTRELRVYASRANSAAGVRRLARHHLPARLSRPLAGRFSDQSWGDLAGPGSTRSSRV